MIRVLVAAASAIARAGLEALVRSDPELEVAGSAPDLPSLDRVPADVVLVQVEELPAEFFPAAPLVLLTHEEAALALRSGARAVLPPDVSPAELLAAIRAAAAGLVVLHPDDLASFLSGSHPAERAADGGDSLTPREVEVLRMLAEGLANKAVAWKLGISEHTVKFHVASILAKLGAATRTEAVAIGMRRGLVLL